MSQWLYQVIAALGHYVISQVRGIGKLALFSWQVFLRLGAGFSRFGLVVQQIHFIGNYSLVIISVSGLLWALCWGCRATTFWCATAANRRWAFWLPCHCCVN